MPMKPDDTPRKYTVADKLVVCPHCGNDLFLTRASLLNTGGMTALGLDFLNREAANFVCSKCGHIQWFLPPKKTKGKRPATE